MAAHFSSDLRKWHWLSSAKWFKTRLVHKDKPEKEIKKDKKKNIQVHQHWQEAVTHAVFVLKHWFLISFGSKNRTWWALLNSKWKGIRKRKQDALAVYLQIPHKAYYLRSDWRAEAALVTVDCIRDAVCLCKDVAIAETSMYLHRHEIREINALLSHFFTKRLCFVLLGGNEKGATN